MVIENTVGEAVSLSAEELDRLFNIGIALSAEQDINVLLENILTTAKEFCNAEGGTLYLMDSEQNQLIFSQKIVSIERKEKSFLDILREIGKRNGLVCGSTNFWRRTGWQADGPAINSLKRAK